MPFGLQPICGVCGAVESQMWSKATDGTIKCNDCNNKDSNDIKEDSNESHSQTKGEQMTESVGDSNDNSNADKSDKTSAKHPTVIRKSVRNKGKIRTTFNSKLNTVKGKSRRIVFKRCVSQTKISTSNDRMVGHQVVRGPTAFATPVTSDNIFFRGQYYQIGDIVSMQDMDGGTYYAQIRGFLQDQYCEKSAVVTWLLPSSHSPVDSFDPSTYFLGPEEDIPRKLECMQFVCHAPSDYYRDPYSPYPTLTMKAENGFVWTRIGPQIVKISQKDQILQEIETNESANV